MPLPSSAVLVARPTGRPVSRGASWAFHDRPSRAPLWRAGVINIRSRVGAHEPSSRLRSRSSRRRSSCSPSPSGATPAHAQDAQAQAAGRALFNEGVALFNKGDFEAACPKFEASLKQFPGIGTRGKLAECYEKLGRYASAYQAYREVAQLATRSGDPAREQVASERAKSLEPKLSYVTVVAASRERRARPRREA